LYTSHFSSGLFLKAQSNIWSLPLFSISFVWPAGTTVHPDWHCYLDNSFVDFDNGEYVALLLNENIEVVHLFAIEYWGISSSSKAFDISSGFLI
jgi:hypothetical protein